MKIALGTAQFGMDYGLSNLNGQTSKKEVFRILQYASQSKINLLDTAPSYGDSESVLGDTIVNQSWKYVLKTPLFSDKKIDNSHVEILKKTFYQSLANLRQTNVYGLLLHSCNDLLRPGGELLLKEMETLKSKGLVDKIGVSVYSSQQIEAILGKFNIELIQLPFNIFDQQLFVDGWLEKIKNNNIEIHSRSVFLQGLLLMPIDSIPQHFLPIKKNLEMFENLSKELSINKLDLALGYAMSISEIDQILIGVNKLSQLKEIIKATKIKLNPLDFVENSIGDPLYINPSKWQL